MNQAIYQNNPMIKDPNARQLYKLNQMFTANLEDYLPEDSRDVLKIRETNKVMLYSDLQKNFLFDRTINKQALWEAYESKDYNRVSRLLEPFMKANVKAADFEKQRGRDYKRILELFQRNQNSMERNNRVLDKNTSGYVKVVNYNHTDVDECDLHIGNTYHIDSLPNLPTHVNCRCEVINV